MGFYITGILCYDKCGSEVCLIHSEGGMDNESYESIPQTAGETGECYSFSMWSSLLVFGPAAILFALSSRDYWQCSVGKYPFGRENDYGILQKTG